MSEAVVAHYRSEYLGATETFIYEVVRRHQRYRPAVLTHARRNEEQFPFPDRVHLLDEPGGEWSRKLVSRSMSLWIASRRRALSKALEEVRPALFHAHFGFDAAIALRPATTAGIPIVASFYGVDATQRAEAPRWKGLIRKVLKRSHLLLVEGPHLRQRLLELGAPPERVRVQPISVRLERFPYRPPRDPAGGRTVLLQPCRFVEKKGVDLSIRAVAEAGCGDGAELWLLGDGPERPALQQLTRDLGVEERVRFLGMKSHEEYAEILRQADVVIHPSRTAASGDSEGGAPTVLLEAQAMGLPVIATRHADIPFVVDTGAALLAREEDVRGLAAHVKHLVAHPEEWRARAAAGRAKVAGQHDPAELAPRLEEMYDEVLSSARRSPA